MKSRERKQKDLVALTERFKNSKSALVLSFNKLTVEKDQQFRNELRETGATYQVVKNTLARMAVKDTEFEDATEYFQGVTSVAWTEGEAVDLSKVVTKYIKDYKDVFEFKGGVVDGKVVDLETVNAIASLPSKEELISKLLYVLNAPAQRLATVLQAVPRDLAIVVKQISEQPEGSDNAAPPTEQKDEAASTDAVSEKATADENAAQADSKADESAQSETLETDDSPAEEKSEE
ncbi:MAG: 50S ribosomal protein L10 [Pyrinomonadaceae bacterium]